MGVGGCVFLLRNCAVSGNCSCWNEGYAVVNSVVKTLDGMRKSNTEVYLYFHNKYDILKNI